MTKCAFISIAVSLSDDEGSLSGMEQLVKSLDKLNKLILQSLKATDVSKQSGTVYERI